LVLRLPKELKVTEKQFDKLCELNQVVQIERTAEGDLVLMGTSPEGSRKNSRLTRYFDAWAEENGTWIAFDSNATFTLPNELGWLIDPYEKTVYIYRPGQPPERLDDPETVSGDPVLPGFVLEMARIWG
jgi:Uma2 family endonuclease